MAIDNIYGSLAPSRGGLAEALGMKPNPFLNFVGDNRSALLGLAAGLAGGSNWGEGLSSGFQLAAEGRQMDQQHAEKLKADALAAKQTNATRDWLAQRYPDLAQAVDAGLPVSEAWNEAFNRMNAKTAAPQNPYMNAGDGTFFNWQTGEFVTGPNAGEDGNAADFKTGFTPIWGTYKGQPATVLPGNDGRFYINGEPIDPNDFVPTNPYDLNAQKSAGSAFGKGTGGVQFSAPMAQNELDQSLAAIGRLNEPDTLAGKEEWFNQAGALPRGMWVQGGSNMAKFRNEANNVIDRSWLSARAALKGGGQITDYEGGKAENAVSMMKAALDSGDKASFDAAVQEYEFWIKQGFAKMMQQAGAIPGYGANQPPPPAPNGDDDIENILSGLGI